jgi:hypothetical protein
MTDQVPTAEAEHHEPADENRALQAARDTRVQFALQAPELARRLVAIAKNDEHAKQLDAIKLALAYSLGAPTVRVEARVQAQPMSREVLRDVTDALNNASAVFDAQGRTPPRLLAGQEVIPRPGEIEAVVAQLEERPPATDAAPPEPPPAEPEPYRPRFDPEAPLRRDVPGVPIRR